MDFAAIRTAIGDLSLEVTGVRKVYPRGADAVAVTPAVVVGMPRADEVIPGNRQVTNMSIPFELLIERTADQARDSALLDSYVNLFVAKFAREQSLNDTVVMAYITEWDSGHFAEYGGATYAGVLFTLTVTVHETMTQALVS